MVFAMDEACSLLLETGYRKPICHLKLSDKDSLRSCLLDYHCMLKVKGAMDQYMDGLEELHVLEILKQYPDILKSVFVNERRVLTAGEEAIHNFIA